MTKRNIGHIRVDALYIRDNPDEVAEIFGRIKFVAVRAEAMFETGEIEYVGLSPFFEAVADGLMAPRYRVHIARGKDGAIENVMVERE